MRLAAQLGWAQVPVLLRHPGLCPFVWLLPRAFVTRRDD